MSYRRKRKKSSDETSTDEPKIVYNQFTSRFETVGRRRRSQTQVKRTPSPLSPAYASSGQTSVERADKELKQISRSSNLQQARNREDVIESVLNDIRVENTTRELSEVNEQLNEINVRLDTKSAERRRKNIVDKKPSVVTEATMRQDVEYAALADDKDALKQKKSELGQQLQFYQTKSRRSEESLTSGFDKDIQGIQNYPAMDIDIQRDPITNKAMSPGERVDFNPILQGTVADPDLSITDVKMKKGKARSTPWYYMRRKFEAGSEKQPGIGKDAPSFGSFPGIQYAYGDDGSTIGVAPTTPKVEAKGDGLTRIGVLGGVIEEDGDDYKTKGDMLQQFASGGVGVFENVGYILEDVQKHGLDVDKYGPVKETAFDLVIDMYLKPFDSKEYETYSAERQTGDWWSDNVGTAMEFMGTSQYRQLHQKQQENTISELTAYPAYYAGSMAVEIATFFVPVKAATYIKPALKLGIAATKKAGYSPQLTKTPKVEKVTESFDYGEDLAKTKTREIPYQRKAKVKDTTGMDVDPDVAGFTRKERIAQRLGEYFEKRSDPEAWFLLTQAKKLGKVGIVQRPVKSIVIPKIQGGRAQEASKALEMDPTFLEKTRGAPMAKMGSIQAEYTSKQLPIEQADVLTSKGQQAMRDVKEELFWTVERSKKEDVFMVRGFQYAEEGGRIVARDKYRTQDALWAVRAIPERTLSPKKFLRGGKKLDKETEDAIEKGFKRGPDMTTSPRFSRKTKNIDFRFSFEEGGGSALSSVPTKKGKISKLADYIKGIKNEEMEDVSKGTILYDSAKSIKQLFGSKKIPSRIKAKKRVLVSTKSMPVATAVVLGLKPVGADVAKQFQIRGWREPVYFKESTEAGGAQMVEASAWEITSTTKGTFGFKNTEELGRALLTGFAEDTTVKVDDAIKVGEKFIKTQGQGSMFDILIGAKQSLGKKGDPYVKMGKKIIKPKKPVIDDIGSVVKGPRTKLIGESFSDETKTLTKVDIKTGETIKIDYGFSEDGVVSVPRLKGSTEEIAFKKKHEKRIQKEAKVKDEPTITIDYNVAETTTVPFDKKTGTKLWKSLEDDPAFDIDPKQQTSIIGVDIVDDPSKIRIDYDAVASTLGAARETLIGKTGFFVKEKLPFKQALFNLRSKKSDVDTGYTTTAKYQEMLAEFVAKSRDQGKDIPQSRTYTQVKQEGMTSKPFDPFAELGARTRREEGIGPDQSYGAFGTSFLEKASGTRKQAMYRKPNVKPATMKEEFEFLRYIQQNVDTRLRKYDTPSRTKKYIKADPSEGYFGQSFKIQGMKTKPIGDQDDNLLFQMLRTLEGKATPEDELAASFRIMKKDVASRQQVILVERESYVPELQARVASAAKSLTDKEAMLAKSKKAEKKDADRLRKLKQLVGTIRRDSSAGFAPETKIDPKTGKVIRTGVIPDKRRWGGFGEQWFPEYEYTSLPKTSAVRRLFEGKLNLAQMTGKDRDEVINLMSGIYSKNKDILDDADFIKFFGTVARVRAVRTYRKSGRPRNIGTRFHNPFVESEVKGMSGLYGHADRQVPTLMEQSEMAPATAAGGRRFDRFIADMYHEPTDFMSRTKDVVSDPFGAYPGAGTNMEKARRPIERSDIIDETENLEDALLKAHEHWRMAIDDANNLVPGASQAKILKAHKQVVKARSKLEDLTGVREPKNLTGRKQVLEGTGGSQTFQGPEQTIDAEFERIINDINLLEMRKLYHQGNRTVSGQELGVAHARKTLIELESKITSISSAQMEGLENLKTAYIGREISLNPASNYRSFTPTSQRLLSQAVKDQNVQKNKQLWESLINDVDYYIDVDTYSNRMVTSSGVSVGRKTVGQEFKLVRSRTVTDAEKAVEKAQKSVDDLVVAREGQGYFVSKTGKNQAFFKGINKERKKRDQVLKKAQATLKSSIANEEAGLPEITFKSALRAALFGSKTEKTLFRSALRNLRITRKKTGRGFEIANSDTRMVVNQAREYSLEGVGKTHEATKALLKHTRGKLTHKTDEFGEILENRELQQYAPDFLKKSIKIEDEIKRMNARAWSADDSAETLDVLSQKTRGKVSVSGKTFVPKDPSGKPKLILETKKDGKSLSLDDARFGDTEQRSVFSSKFASEVVTQSFPPGSPLWSGGIGVGGSGLVGGKIIQQAWGTSSTGGAPTLPLAPDGGIMINPSQPSPITSLPSIQRSIELPSVTVGTGIESASKLSPNVVTAARTLIRQTVTPIPQQAIKPVQAMAYKQALMPTVPLTTTIPAVAPRPIPPPPPNPPMMPVFWELPDADPRKRKKIKPKKQKKKKIYWFAPADPFTPFDPKEYKVFTGRESKFIKRVEKRRFGDDSVNTLG